MSAMMILLRILHYSAVTALIFGGLPALMRGI